MNKKNIKRIATERIEILIDNALREMHNDENLSQSYAKLARKIAMRVRIRMPYWMRQLFCRKCKQFIVPGINSRIRIGRAKVKSIRITCMKCNHVYRKLIES
jgi:ribonuclease P protein subunit RPR2